MAEYTIRIETDKEEHSKQLQKLLRYLKNNDWSVLEVKPKKKQKMWGTFRDLQDILKFDKE